MNLGFSCWEKQEDQDAERRSRPCWWKIEGDREMEIYKEEGGYVDAEEGCGDSHGQWKMDTLTKK